MRKTTLTTLASYTYKDGKVKQKKKTHRINCYMLLPRRTAEPPYPPQTKRHHTLNDFNKTTPPKDTRKRVSSDLGDTLEFSPDQDASSPQKIGFSNAVVPKATYSVTPNGVDTSSPSLADYRDPSQSVTSPRRTSARIAAASHRTSTTGEKSLEQREEPLQSPQIIKRTGSTPRPYAYKTAETWMPTDT
jgi:hypothetical protein